MHFFPLIFFLFFFFTQYHLQVVAELCSAFSCNRHRRDPIQFPFWVPDNQTSRCGFPGFELYCNSAGQTLLPLEPGLFTVQGISYPDQLIWVSDPNQCIPERVINLSDKKLDPFSYGPYGSTYTFLNCSGPNLDPALLPGGVSVISCMGGRNHTVVAALDDVAEGKMRNGSRSRRKCEVIKRVNAAFWWEDMEYGVFPVDMSDVLVQLSWDSPRCVNCMLRGGSCGLVDDTGLQVGCFLPSPSGLPKSAKYGLMLGAGIPGILCIVGLTFYISSRISTRNQNRRYSNTESSPSIFPQPIILTLGLDAPTIESYPKTILGESKRLPKPSDSTCPICLSEYQPKETIRSIPDCNHYFHADCIDEWLRMNATCPLCRNSPQPSSALAGS